MGKTVTRRSKHTSWDNPNQGGHKMYDDQQEWKACSRKSGAYGHEKEALAIAANFEDRGTERVWRAYKCPFCKKWHLTNKGLK